MDILFLISARLLFEPFSTIRSCSCCSYREVSCLESRKGSRDSALALWQACEAVHEVLVSVELLAGL